MSKLWENIFKHRKSADRIEEVLATIPVFQELRGREMQAIKRILHRREYRTNEFIFREGDAGLGMYIIISGKVRITCGNEGQPLAELADGDFFGELSLLDEAPRSASAIAETPSVLLCFFKPELLDIIDRNPKLGCKIIFRLAWTIGERLKTTNEQLRAMKCPDMPKQ